MRIELVKKGQLPKLTKKQYESAIEFIKKRNADVVSHLYHNGMKAMILHLSANNLQSDIDDFMYKTKLETIAHKNYSISYPDSSSTSGI